MHIKWHNAPSRVISLADNTDNAVFHYAMVCAFSVHKGFLLLHTASGDRWNRLQETFAAKLNVAEQTSSISLSFLQNIKERT